MITFLYPLAPVKIQLEKCHRQYPKMLISREHSKNSADPFCFDIYYIELSDDSM